jgi:hypothetical protein
MMMMMMAEEEEITDRCGCGSHKLGWAGLGWASVRFPSSACYVWLVD